MYKINPKILQTHIANGSILLLEPEAGLYFELNASSVFIYQYIVAGLDNDEILEKLLQSTQLKNPRPLPIL
ncbi:hypothetical protein MNBD_GAMMA01-834 [hydrothermal vent metagenome]|uniref:Uncharacterized protein n=1 Tax=hydrothermal vent metagenome TaxID=652676 RepID=A0A3B0V811_9ZZZZ